MQPINPLGFHYICRHTASRPRLKDSNTCLHVPRSDSDSHRYRITAHKCPTKSSSGAHAHAHAHIPLFATSYATSKWKRNGSATSASRSGSSLKELIAALQPTADDRLGGTFQMRGGGRSPYQIKPTRHDTRIRRSRATSLNTYCSCINCMRVSGERQVLSTCGGAAVEEVVDCMYWWKRSTRTHVHTYARRGTHTHDWRLFIHRYTRRL